MKKKPDIPSHDYIQAVDNVQYINGQPILSLDANSPFALTKYELMNESGQAEYPHRHDFYEVIYITEGEGTHIIDFESYPIQPSTFYFISKGQIHFWQLTKPLKGYVLLIPEEFLGFPSSEVVRAHDFSFFHNVGSNPYLSVNKESFSQINGLLEGIEQEFHNEMDLSLSAIRSYLHILLIKLHRMYSIDHSDECSKKASPLLRQFEQLVSEYFIVEHSVRDYSKRIGVSTNYLTDIIKAATGKSPGHIIRQKLILEAKRLLAHSALTAAEIGYRLNFEDSSYFGRFFKRETGMSPTVFRQQIREQYKIFSE